MRQQDEERLSIAVCAKQLLLNLLVLILLLDMFVPHELSSHGQSMLAQLLHFI